MLLEYDSISTENFVLPTALPPLPRTMLDAW